MNASRVKDNIYMLNIALKHDVNIGERERAMLLQLKITNIVKGYLK